jgi:hypothetical protein
MSAVNTSETSVIFCQTTHNTILEDSYFLTSLRENLKSHMDKEIALYHINALT